MTQNFLEMVAQNLRRQGYDVQAERSALCVTVAAGDENMFDDVQLVFRDSKRLVQAARTATDVSPDPATAFRAEFGVDPSERENLPDADWASMVFADMLDDANVMYDRLNALGGDMELAVAAANWQMQEKNAA